MKDFGTISLMVGILVEEYWAWQQLFAAAFRLNAIEAVK